MSGIECSGGNAEEYEVALGEVFSGAFTAIALGGNDKNEEDIEGKEISGSKLAEENCLKLYVNVTMSRDILIPRAQVL